MKKLSDFQENKVELKEIKGGTYGNPSPKISGWVIWEYPGGASTAGNFQSLVHGDISKGSFY